jgi:NAD-dependent dihydropyrimidine dehydrogenase PreA subunit
MEKPNFAFRSVAPAKPIVFNEELCISCNRCVDACPIDLMLPAEKGGTPTAAYPDECWYCGSCVVECPTGAIRLQHPLMNRARWARRDSLTKGGK